MPNGPTPTAIYSLHPDDAAARNAHEAAGGWVPPFPGAAEALAHAPMLPSAREAIERDTGLQIDLLEQARQEGDAREYQRGEDDGHDVGYDDGYQAAAEEIAGEIGDLKDEATSIFRRLTEALDRASSEAAKDRRRAA